MSPSGVGNGVYVNLTTCGGSPYMCLGKEGEEEEEKVQRYSQVTFCNSLLTSKQYSRYLVH